MLDLSQFAGRLREAIHRAGVKQNALARAVGISQNSLSRYLMGSRNPSQPVLRALARELQVTVEYLGGEATRAELPEQPGTESGTTVRATIGLAPDTPEDYIPDAVALTGLDAEDRRTVLRLVAALRSGDAEIRRYLMDDLRIIELAMQARRQQPRKDGLDAT